MVTTLILKGFNICIIAAVTRGYQEATATTAIYNENLLLELNTEILMVFHYLKT